MALHAGIILAVGAGQPSRPDRGLVGRLRGPRSNGAITGAPPRGVGFEDPSSEPIAPSGGPAGTAAVNHGRQRCHHPSSSILSCPIRFRSPRSIARRWRDNWWRQRAASRPGRCTSSEVRADRGEEPPPCQARAGPGCAGIVGPGRVAPRRQATPNRGWPTAPVRMAGHGHGGSDGPTKSRGR